MLPKVLKTLSVSSFFLFFLLFGKATFAFSDTTVPDVPYTTGGRTFNYVTTIPQYNSSTGMRYFYVKYSDKPFVSTTLHSSSQTYITHAAGSYTVSYSCDMQTQGHPCGSPSPVYNSSQGVTSGSFYATDSQSCFSDSRMKLTQPWVSEISYNYGTYHCNLGQVDVNEVLAGTNFWIQPTDDSITFPIDGQSYSTSTLQSSGACRIKGENKYAVIIDAHGATTPPEAFNITCNNDYTWNASVVLPALADQNLRVSLYSQDEPIYDVLLEEPLLRVQQPNASVSVNYYPISESLWYVNILQPPVTFSASDGNLAVVNVDLDNLNASGEEEKHLQIQYNYNRQVPIDEVYLRVKWKHSPNFTGGYTWLIGEESSVDGYDTDGDHKVSIPYSIADGDTKYFDVTLEHKVETSPGNYQYDLLSQTIFAVYGTRTGGYIDQDKADEWSFLTSPLKYLFMPDETIVLSTFDEMYQRVRTVAPIGYFYALTDAYNAFSASAEYEESEAKITVSGVEVTYWKMNDSIFDPVRDTYEYIRALITLGIWFSVGWYIFERVAHAV